jgi:NAD(P)-dependent dehydrogenase (short-subunit alcohol dehydrogenase family)
MAPRLESKVAIVTGAGQGIGRGVALALAGEGARVALVGRTKGKLDTVVGEIGQRGGEALAVVGDVEHRDQVDAAVDATVAEWGRLDIVVNNAQTLAYNSLRRLTEDDLESMWQSGPMGTFRMLQASFEHLRAAKGCVVNMGSGSSILPRPAMGGYAMAKEAIRVLTRAAAVEWGRHGIRVNAVCPLADTPGMDFFDGQTGAYEEMVIPEVPLGRMGEAEADVGRSVVYLCSDDAAYVTGTTLMVDGGYNYLR